MVNISKRFSILFSSLLLVLSLSFVAQPSVTHAASCYKSGYATFSTYWTSPVFYYPGGYMKMGSTYYASKNGTLWRVNLYKSSGSWKADTGDRNAETYTKTNTAVFYTGSSFYIPAGNYYLKFGNVGYSYGTATTHVTSYCIHN